ncbi:unnamed protein product, partial [Symbiodinium sp. KB8]
MATSNNPLHDAFFQIARRCLVGSKCPPTIVSYLAYGVYDLASLDSALTSIFPGPSTFFKSLVTSPSFVTTDSSSGSLVVTIDLVEAAQFGEGGSINFFFVFTANGNTRNLLGKTRSLSSSGSALLRLGVDIQVAAHGDTGVLRSNNARLLARVVPATAHIKPLSQPSYALNLYSSLTEEQDGWLRVPVAEAQSQLPPFLRDNSHIPTWLAPANGNRRLSAAARIPAPRAATEATGVVSTVSDAVASRLWGVPSRCLTPFPQFVDLNAANNFEATVALVALDDVVVDEAGVYGVEVEVSSIVLAETEFEEELMGAFLNSNFNPEEIWQVLSESFDVTSIQDRYTIVHALEAPAVTLNVTDNDGPSTTAT